MVSRRLRMRPERILQAAEHTELGLSARGQKPVVCGGVWDDCFGDYPDIRPMSQKSAHQPLMMNAAKGWIELILLKNRLEIAVVD